MCDAPFLSGERSPFILCCVNVNMRLASIIIHQINVDYHITIYIYISRLKVLSSNVTNTVRYEFVTSNFPSMVYLFCMICWLAYRIYRVLIESRGCMHVTLYQKRITKCPLHIYKSWLYIEANLCIICISLNKI